MLQKDSYHGSCALIGRSLTSSCANRAYKLGKKRWSYNQCALTLQQAGGAKSLSVSEAASSQQSVPESHQVRRDFNLRPRSPPADVRVTVDCCMLTTRV